MRTRWLAAALTVVAVAAGGTAWALKRDDGKTAAPVVATVAADVGEVKSAVATTGTVQPSDTRTLSFAVDGTVATVSVRAGSKVKAGALLATVDSTDAADAVSDAQDALDDANDQLDAAEAAATAAAAAKAKAAATAKAAAAAKAASKAAKDAGATAAAASGTGTGAAAGPGTGTGTGSGSGTGTDAIFTAQQRVNQAKLTLENAEVALAGVKIKSPIAGTVMSVSGTVGSDVTKGSTFVTVADTYHMQISASFPEADAGRLANGQAATVTLADRVGETFDAKVTQVDPVGVSDGTLVKYGVLLTFTKPPSDLLSGQSAQVEVVTGEVASTLRVPSTAVHNIVDGKGVVQVGGAARTVGVGLRGDQYTQISSGLTAGEVVARTQ